eukprot:4435127-Prymnesium_polylepis.1
MGARKYGDRSTATAQPPTGLDIVWIRPHGWTAQLGESRPPASLRCPLTRLQVRTAAAAVLPVVVASQSVE